MNDTGSSAPFVPCVDPKTLPSPVLSTSTERGVCSPTASLFGRGNVEGFSSKVLNGAASFFDDQSRGVDVNSVFSQPDQVEHSIHAKHADLDPAAAAEVEGNLAADPNETFALHGASTQQNIPGYNASTIKIHSLWHCLPRKIISSGSHFGHFFQAMLSKPNGVVHSETSTASPWPMPLPYPFKRNGSN